MLLRKINAVISLLVTLLILDHTMFHAVWMISKGTVEKSEGSMSFVLVGLVLIHAIISIAMAIFAHRNSEKRPYKQYPKMNVATLVQRISGILMVILGGLHIVGALGLLHTPRIVFATITPIFFAIVLAHAAISTSKAFITLGIGGARFVKAVDVAMKVICALTLIADIAGFYIFLG